MLRQPLLSKRRLKAPCPILLLALLPLAGCIENPFNSDDKISGGTRSVNGTVQLNDRASPEGTFVWLESFNLGSRADAGGKFSLTLPPPGAQGGNGGATGFFNLYYYLANYSSNTATVATRNGAFIYSEADINQNGEIVNTTSLRKFLRINTVLTPTSVPSSTTQLIDVQVSLQALGDSVSIIIPETPGAGNLMGALLLRSLSASQPQVFIYKTSALGSVRERVTLSSAQQHVRNAALSLISLPLPPGEYEVIPYILIRHQSLPLEMMTALGPNLESLSPNYLQIPMRREGGRLQITP